MWISSGGENVLTVAQQLLNGKPHAARLAEGGSCDQKGRMQSRTRLATQFGAVHGDVLRLIDVELMGNRADCDGAMLAATLLAIWTNFVCNEAELDAGTGRAPLASLVVWVSSKR
jgi:hypothetical protein